MADIELNVCETTDQALTEINEFPNEGESFSLKTCFLGLFAGATKSGMVIPNGVISMGKAECEPDNWRRYYDKLAALGLIEYGVNRHQGKGMLNGGPFTSIDVVVTDFGRSVREEYWQLWQKKVDAIDHYEYIT